MHRPVGGLDRHQIQPRALFNGCIRHRQHLPRRHWNPHQNPLADKGIRQAIHGDIDDHPALFDLRVDLFNRPRAALNIHDRAHGQAQGMPFRDRQTQENTPTGDGRHRLARHDHRTQTHRNRQHAAIRRGQHVAILDQGRTHLPRSLRLGDSIARHLDRGSHLIDALRRRRPLGQQFLIAHKFGFSVLKL